MSTAHDKLEERQTNFHHIDNGSLEFVLPVGPDLHCTVLYHAVFDPVVVPFLFNRVIPIRSRRRICCKHACSVFTNFSQL